MKTIRTGVFETNSSSTHSITIMMKSDFEKWKESGLYYFAKELLTKEEAIERMKQGGYKIDWSDPEIVEDYLRDFARTYEQWADQEYLETFEEEFTTTSGDVIVAFGEYGNDNY